MAQVIHQTIKRLVGINILLLIFFALAPAQEALASARDWEPQRTWVFVVGAISFKHSDMFESYPQENRRDAQLVQFFREQGVPSSQIVYLRDREATESRIKSALASHLSRAGHGDWLFMYYTGHGYKTEDDDAYLASYDTGDDGVLGWEVNSIPQSIERYFRGSRAFLTLDNCYSGALAEAVSERESRISYAVLTSATSEQVSTGEWTFTETLLAALRGKAYEDSNSDGQITLEELAHQVQADMSFTEKQRAVFTTTGDFSPQMVLSRAERKRSARVGERVVVRSEGDWYKGQIIDFDSDDSQFLIHYYGYDDSYDEWVEARQIRQPRVNRPATNRKVYVGAARELYSH